MNTTLKTHSICLMVILSAYLASRLYGLMAIPLFIDEAIHIEFGKVAMLGGLRVGTDIGKWLSVQTYGLIMKTFVDSMFFARLVPVGLGMLTCIMLFTEGCSFGGKSRSTRGTFNALIYLVTPFALFYDRVVLTDQFLTVILSLIFLFSYRICKKITIVDLVGLCVALILAPLFKFSGVFLLPIPLLIILINTKRGFISQRLRKLAVPYAISVPVILAFITRCSPRGESSKLVDFRSLSSMLTVTIKNTQEVALLFWRMLTPGLFIILIFGTVVTVLSSDCDRRKRVMAAAVVLVVLLFPYIVLFRVWYPRYHLPLLVPISLLGGEVAQFVWDHARRIIRHRGTILVQSLVLTVLIISPVVNLIHLLTSPSSFSYYDAIRKQYFTGWTSGYGLTDAVHELQRLSHDNPNGINVLRSRNWDHPLLGVDVYYRDLGTRVYRRTLRHWNANNISQSISQVLSDEAPTYLLFNSAYPYPGDQEVVSELRRSFQTREVAHFVKCDGNPGLRIWHIEKRTGHNTLNENDEQ